MQLACASYSFPLLSLEQAARIVATLGFRYMDVGAWPIPANLAVDEIEANPGRVAERLRRVAGAEGLAYSDFFPVFGATIWDSPINTRDPAARAANDSRFTSFVRLCQASAIPGITLLPGVLWPGLSERACLDLAVAPLRRYVEQAHDAGLRLSVEPHMESVIEDPDRAAELVAAVPGLTLTIDYAHFVAAGTPVERVHPLLQHAGHVQARQGASGKVQASRDEGTIDFADIVARLGSLRYDGYVAVEYVWQEWRGNNRVDVISETVLLRDTLRAALSR